MALTPITQGDPRQAENKKIELMDIQPGKPMQNALMQNAFVKRFNRTYLTEISMRIYSSISPTCERPSTAGLVITTCGGLMTASAVCRRALSCRGILLSKSNYEMST